ncbi:MAG: A/G-specific adenine glycosylase [Oscillospiraceae bacterium]
MNPAEILGVEEQTLLRLSLIRSPLLEWFRENARSMPWRDSPTPYHVWISEVMLQQTRVEAVRSYFQRFVDELPDIPSLAKIPEQRLLKLWEGLGYYSRARNLQKAAQLLVNKMDSQLPANYEALKTLPGIGEYTAGAISSIAFGIPVPAVDGNVYRVLSRLTASQAEITSPAVKKAWFQVAASLVPEDSPGQFNQALMELGATVCLPNGAPLCSGCHLAAQCAAKEQGCQESLPRKAPKKPRVQEERTIVLILSENRVLLTRRESGLLIGMWEPLNLEGGRSAPEVEEALEQLGGTSAVIEVLPSSKHIFTHREWHMTGWLARTAAFPAPPGWEWAQNLSSHPLPSAFAAYTKLLPELLAEG